MKIAYCGNISLDLLDLKVEHPSSYSYPLGAALVRKYLELGHEVHVVTHAPRSEDLFVYRKGPLSVCVVPLRRRYQYCSDLFSKERTAMQRSIQNAECDVVHGQWTYEFAHTALKSGLPYLVTAHDSPLAILQTMPSAHRLYLYLYARHLIPKLKNISAVSPHIAESLQKDYHLEKKPTVIPNGIDFLGSPKSTQDQANKKVVTRFISVSGGCRVKNVKVLIKAFHQVKKALPDAELALIGDRLGEEDPIARWAGSRGFDSGVKFVGKIPHGEVMKKLRNPNQIFVHPSLEESFCMTLLEAMNAGLPVIGGLFSGAVPWLLRQGEVGLLADCRLPEDLAEKMIALSKDCVLRSKLVEEAYEWIQSSFSLQYVAEAYSERLEQIVSAQS